MAIKIASPQDAFREVNNLAAKKRDSRPKPPAEALEEMHWQEATPAPVAKTAPSQSPALVKKAGGKTAIKIRLDNDVLDAYRKTGRFWQTRINDDLRKHLGI